MEIGCGAIGTSGILADAVAVDGYAGDSAGVWVEGVVQSNGVGLVEIRSAGVGVAARIAPEADFAGLLATCGGKEVQDEE